MKKTLLFGATLLAIVQVCSAATCKNGTLANYFSLGSSGCTIGNDRFYDFQTVPGTEGAAPLADGSIDIHPGGGTYKPSLTFTTNQTASSGDLLEAIFTYDVSGGGFYTSSSLSLMSSSETVDGGVTDIENFCAGGSFGPDGVDGCTGTAGSLLTLDGIQNTDHSMLGPASSLNVTDDFTLDGGTAGSAKGGVFTNSFTAVPEPTSLFMGALGFALIAGARLRRTCSNFKRVSKG